MTSNARRPQIIKGWIIKKSLIGSLNLSCQGTKPKFKIHEIKSKMISNGRKPQNIKSGISQQLLPGSFSLDAFLKFWWPSKSRESQIWFETKLIRFGLEPNGKIFSFGFVWPTNYQMSFVLVCYQMWEFHLAPFWFGTKCDNFIWPHLFWPGWQITK